MMPGQANEIISRPTRQSMRRVRSGTYSRSVTTNATQTDGERRDQDPLDAEVPDGDEEDGEDDLGQPARQRIGDEPAAAGAAVG